MGGVLYAQQQKDKAFAELNRAIEIDPKRVESYLSLARFYIDQQGKRQSRGTLQESNSSKRKFVGGPHGIRQVSDASRIARQRLKPSCVKAVEVGPTDRNCAFRARQLLSRQQAVRQS